MPSPIDSQLTGRHGEPVMQAVANLLADCKRHGIRLATAESLTGGGIAQLLTELPGSSEMLDRSYVTYNNQAKAEMLGVSAQDLEIHEAVSRPVAEQMALGALQRSNAQIAVAVTGYAGASGDDSRAIPGGTVFIATAYRRNLQAEPEILQVARHQFSPERQACRQQTIAAAIDQLTLAMQRLTEKPDPACTGDIEAAGSSNLTIS